jgi:hypothetical protein
MIPYCQDLIKWQYKSKKVFLILSPVQTRRQRQQNLASEERMLPLIFDNSSDRRISQFVYAEANHPSSEMRIVSPTERSENAAAFS